MESIFLLIPVSVLLVFGIAYGFWWSVRSGQFDDMEGPGFKVVMDDDRPESCTKPSVEQDQEAKGEHKSSET
jgi:cbb3-type cytochrome oxidase maturation protein